MPTEDDNGQTPFDTPAAPPLPSASVDVPYSIFDKRQKVMIVFIVSTAATCKYMDCGSVVFD